ncbi:hypothetical protein POM88_001156 [Heracleum sosnowskyi]|uniref:CCHC-type domain-containing protein n=1 Tax=Heracleum sosnowskyi TaxID=360622 RepID=A0AAD8NAH3_9APIA|nr:hypothetical protein POM88_001156 [Heracleum sosnowskyi]
MALKAILIDENENDEELNEELQNLDEREISLLMRQLRRVLQSKAQRYGKVFLKSNNQQRVFNSNGRPNYSQNYTPNYNSNFPSTSYNKDKGIQNTNAYTNANNNNNPSYTPPKTKEQISEETQDVCFECKQPGHFKRECPKLVKGRSQEVTSNLNYITNKLQLDESNLNFLDMSKYDVIELVVGINNKYKDVDRRLHLLWSEKMKLEEMHYTQRKEFTRMMDLKIQNEDEITSLSDQNHHLKVENNKFKENVLKLEIENVALILQVEEMESEKLQLYNNICKLHVDILNWKILNESIVQDNVTSQSQENNLEKESELSQTKEPKEKEFEIEAQRLKEENYKLTSQVVDQERFLNNKIDALIKEKENLEVVIQRFTKGNEMLDKMVHSKNSFNREGLGYDKKAQPKQVVQKDQQPKVTSPTPPSFKCSYCNKNGHTVQYCKFKNGEIKGKHVWIRKGSKPYPEVEKHVPFNKVAYNGQKQQRFQQPSMFQNRKHYVNTSGHASRTQHVPNHNVYFRSATHDRNTTHHVNSRFYDNARYTQYHARPNAPRNLYMPNYAYPMPIFFYENSNVSYDKLTQGPSRQRGTYKFN